MTKCITDFQRHAISAIRLYLFTKHVEIHIESYDGRASRHNDPITGHVPSAIKTFPDEITPKYDEAV